MGVKAHLYFHNKSNQYKPKPTKSGQTNTKKPKTKPIQFKTKKYRGESPYYSFFKRKPRYSVTLLNADTAMLIMGGKMKGNLADMIFLTVIFLAFCISSVLAYVIWSSMTGPITDALTQANGGTLAAGSAIAITQTTQTLLMFDQLFIFMIIGSFIAIIISSFFLSTHPIFFITSFLAWIFSFVIYAILGNVFYEFITANGISSVASSFPLMTSFWANVPTIALAMSVVLLVVLYARIRGGKPNAYST